MGRGFRNNLHSGVRGDKQQPKKEKKLEMIYDDNKYEKYLLNLEHSNGKSKAKFFSDSLGYNKGDGKVLNKAINSEISKAKPVTITKTEYGEKYVFHIKLKPNDRKHNSRNIVVVAIKKYHKIKLRLVTAYPYKKEK